MIAVPRMVVAQCIGDWAEKQRVLVSNPRADKTRKVHPQSTAAVPLCKVPNFQVFPLGPPRNWDSSIRGPCFHPYVHPPCDATSDKVVKMKERCPV